MKKSLLTPLITLLLFLGFTTVSALAKSAREVTPLLIGSQVPNVKVANSDGEKTALSSILEGKRTILIFYRGGWCPYCSMHLGEIAEVKDDLMSLGYQIVAISPDSPENIQEAIEELNPEYELYSDATLEAADAFGISWRMTDVAAARMKANHGHDLAVYSGGYNTENKLPVPSVFITTPDQQITFNYVDPKITFRIPGELLLAAAKTSLEFHKIKD
jgi:peroxiredoxin